MEVSRFFKLLTDDEKQKERFLRLCENKNLSGEDLKLICETITTRNVYSCGPYENHDLIIKKKYSGNREVRAYIGKAILI